MTKRDHVWRAPARACLLASMFVLTLAAAAHLEGGGAGALSRRARGTSFVAQGERVDIRLRSLTTRATGKLTIESSEGGGRARLTTLDLPDPQTVAAGATTYVVWAVSGGRILRLGELRRDQRGNGGLAFDRPEGFDRYSVIVTAEASADVERPGDPVLTTRADEAAALYPSKREAGDESKRESAEASNSAAASNRAGTSNRSDSASNGAAAASGADATTAKVSKKSKAMTPSFSRRVRGAAAGDFYSEVEDALTSNGGGRIIELQGEAAALSARGSARATTRARQAYVLANFRDVPLPSAEGANVYVLWGIVPDGRIIYMGSLPVTEDLNRAEVYVRVAGFDSDDYTLFVTAEQRRPAPSPAGRRVLKPKNASFIVE